MAQVVVRGARLIAQVALRTIHEIFAADPVAVVDMVTFIGRVSAIDKATGQPIRPMLVTVSAPHDKFSTFVLTEVDPVVCLKHLNALVSPHPYDLEAVSWLATLLLLPALVSWRRQPPGPTQPDEPTGPVQTAEVTS